jgi:hypothetical protein
MEEELNLVPLLGYKWTNVRSRCYGTRKPIKEEGILFILYLLLEYEGTPYPFKA